MVINTESYWERISDVCNEMLWDIREEIENKGRISINDEIINKYSKRAIVAIEYNENEDELIIIDNDGEESYLREQDYDIIVAVAEYLENNLNEEEY